MQIYAPLTSRVFIADDIVEVSFDVSNTCFIFEPGQYVSVTLPGLEERPIPDQSHDFSIVSSPTNREFIQIACRVSGSIFKTTLMSLEVGNKVMLSGPKGVFTLPKQASEPIIFIAGGIGITPFMSMLRHASETQQAYDFTLFYRVPTKNNYLYQAELKRLKNKNKKQKIFVIDEQLQAEHLRSTLNKNMTALWYIAGSPKSVKYSRLILENLGIIHAHIFTEGFTGYGQ